MRTRRCLGFLALVCIVLAGCGERSSTSSTTFPTLAVPHLSSTPVKAPVNNANAVAYVSQTPITKASYEHWLTVEKADGATGKAGHRALSFLITSEWVLGEAAAKGVSASEAEAQRQLSKIEKQSFPKPSALKKFLAQSHETKSDLLMRERIEMLESRIVAKVTSGHSGSQSKAALASFQKSFAERWKHYTTCKPEYVMEDCSEYRGRSENLTARPSQAAQSEQSGRSSSNGEIPTPPTGAMAITSPAFELNEQMPSDYTCDGAGISPPLEWQNIPAKAKALVLFVIDDTTAGKSGGIRWIVGDIDPHSKGVAAGKTPAGGIVGSNSENHSDYASICPAKGKSTTIQFQLYALKQRIPLTRGFQPQTAETEYGGTHKLFVGQGATYYATYRRS